MKVLSKKGQLLVKGTSLKGVKLITPFTIFNDFRGDYVETYNKEIYNEAGITAEFVQDDYATSCKHVLRGIHGDDTTAKLIDCIYGSLYVIIVNNDPASTEYKQWASFSISSRDKNQLFVPEKFGTSYLVMSDLAIFHYKQTDYYNNQQFTIKWNDPEYSFWWPIENPITSIRDNARCP